MDDISLDELLKDLDKEKDNDSTTGSSSGLLSDDSDWVRNLDNSSGSGLSRREPESSSLERTNEGESGTEGTTGEGGRTEEESKGDVAGRSDLPELPKGITEEIVDRVVSSAWLSHMLEGSVNVEFISGNLPKNVVLPKGWTLGKVLLLPHVAVKLEARGVPKPTESDVLTPKQIQALVVITNARGLKWQSRLKQAGVSISEWNSWLKQPNFRMVYDRYAEGRLKEAIPEGITALSDKAADGDINAIKLVFEMTGRHSPNGEKEVNVQSILVGIVEILQQELHDGETLMRVVNRIKGLQTGIGIAQGSIKGELDNG